MSTSNPKILNKEKEKILKSYFPRIYDDYIQCFEDQRNLRLYRGSKIIQTILKIMTIFKDTKHLPK